MRCAYKSALVVVWSIDMDFGKLRHSFGVSCFSLFLSLPSHKSSNGLLMMEKPQGELTVYTFCKSTLSAPRPVQSTLHSMAASRALKMSSIALFLICGVLQMNFTFNNFNSMVLQVRLAWKTNNNLDNNNNTNNKSHTCWQILQVKLTWHHCSDLKFHSHIK